MRQSGEKVRSLREESNPGNCTDGGGDTDSTYHQHHMRRVWDIFYMIIRINAGITAVCKLTRTSRKYRGE